MNIRWAVLAFFLRCAAFVCVFERRWPKDRILLMCVSSCKLIILKRHVRNRKRNQQLDDSFIYFLPWLYRRKVHFLSRLVFLTLTLTSFLRNKHENMAKHLCQTTYCSQQTCSVRREVHGPGSERSRCLGRR